MGKSTKNGFSLIEVLVSIVVLALGVLGAAGMQLAAMRTAQQSAIQTFAFQLAAEMAGAMRAGHGRLLQENGADPFIGLDYQSVADGDLQTPAKLCYGIECNAQELAEFEMYEWKTRVKEALPGGRIVVCRDSSPWSSAARALTWNCDGAVDSTAPVVIKLGWQVKNPDGSLLRDASGISAPSVSLAVAL
ncbi:type IV pilus modification protein PilV [Noviherbaspirillum sp. UKPF54]|uniref:type IV pilus modification protein PilV n=1 Tax=Noviherbaspirillum sp. UKPF54 TaxID=2601898 RepID=UPI0011B17E59|nr:type IV pilus modification protein PilV [Noviherbaspirillum sp. UKPF54]